MSTNKLHFYYNYLQEFSPRNSTGNRDRKQEFDQIRDIFAVNTAARCLAVIFTYSKRMAVPYTHTHLHFNGTTRAWEAKTPPALADSE